MIKSSQKSPEKVKVISKRDITSLTAPKSRPPCSGMCKLEYLCTIRGVTALSICVLSCQRAHAFRNWKLLFYEPLFGLCTFCSASVVNAIKLCGCYGVWCGNFIGNWWCGSKWWVVCGSGCIWFRNNGWLVGIGHVDSITDAKIAMSVC